MRLELIVMGSSKLRMSLHPMARHVLDQNQENDVGDERRRHQQLMVKVTKLLTMMTVSKTLTRKQRILEKTRKRLRRTAKPMEPRPKRRPRLKLKHPGTQSWKMV